LVGRGQRAANVFPSSGFVAPSDIIFLSRVIGGMYGTLRRFNASGNWGQLLRAYLYLVASRGSADRCCLASPAAVVLAAQQLHLQDLGVEGVEAHLSKISSSDSTRLK
jgi:hypothetical protein